MHDIFPLMTVILVYFLYGLAFFSMGLFIFALRIRFGNLTLAKPLLWLGLFGIVHGFAEWGMMFISIQEVYRVAFELLYYQRVVEIFFIALSFAFLLQFSVSLHVHTQGGSPKLHLLSISLFLLWLLIFLFFRYLIPTDNPFWWIRFSEIGSRYLLALPGAIWAGLVILQQKTEWEQIVRRKLSFHVYGAALAFLLYGFVGGLVVPPAPFFPASVINTQIFYEIFRIPVPIFRAFCGLAMAYFTIHILSLFNAEMHRRLDEAERKQTLSSERERISQNLHDGVIQNLYGIGLVLENTRYLLEEKEKEKIAQESLDRVMGHLNSIIVEIRLFVHDLRPLRIIKGTLIDIIEERLMFFRKASSLSIRYKILGAEPTFLSTQLKENILLIVNESITNVLRHAKASEINVMIAFGDEIHLQIQDDGVGIPSKQRLGFGITSMEERALRLGGHLEVISPPEGGTLIEAFFPYRDGKESKSDSRHDSR
ncbi:sensor histidine kinase [Heliorestis acidaminivorans]|uniref:histidine kinase n=1 Tax=Heliorestis acidaminivorans TaxID=553427 RepID=A0A6I0F5Q3_9FIRM|nr:sensor histidine kinase [Heliorestis acidaminivorans]KAB2954302.1 sensor histidine kinase [Heliorestis acidaminivorans]